LARRVHPELDMKSLRFRTRLVARLLVLVTLTLAAAAPQPALAEAVFLVIDEDSIDNGNPPNSFSEQDVNDDLAEIGLRKPLRFFAANTGSTITLHTGQVGDEGWFALKTIPPEWDAVGPTDDGLLNFLLAGPGLGSPNRDNDREALLDKIPDVTPLRATGLKLLEGWQVCAVVFDSDISINYDPLEGSLKGENLGIVAFEVLRVTRLIDGSSSSLPEVEIGILDATAVCEGPLELFLDAPVPISSSEPFDVDPPDTISVSDDGVVNAASFEKPVEPMIASVAPGALISIFGRGFTDQTVAADSLPLPETLGGVTVTFDGKPGRLLFVSPSQINVQVPWNVLGGNNDDFKEVVLGVSLDAGVTATVTVGVGSHAPGVFTFEFGSGPAVAVRPNGVVAQPAGAIPGVSSAPAQRGEIILLLATGLGEVDDDIDDGANSLDRIRRTAVTPKVWIGGREARVPFSGLSAEFAGVNQLNVEVPMDAPIGPRAPIQIEVNGRRTTEGVTIAVE
jgi:uncharacterized protein (TIGR03437 family)